jgi:hypothetical protein
MLSRLADELLASSIFSQVLRTALRTAMEAKGLFDRNVDVALTLLNLPSRGELVRLQTKLEVIHGSLVNLNIKMDRLLAARGGDADGDDPTRRSAPRRDGGAARHAGGPAAAGVLGSSANKWPASACRSSRDAGGVPSRGTSARSGALARVRIGASVARSRAARRDRSRCTSCRRRCRSRGRVGGSAGGGCGGVLHLPA